MLTEVYDLHARITFLVKAEVLSRELAATVDALDVDGHLLTVGHREYDAGGVEGGVVDGDVG